VGNVEEKIFGKKMMLVQFAPLGLFSEITKLNLFAIRFMICKRAFCQLLTFSTTNKTQ
jgi:hypothetical protein